MKEEDKYWILLSRYIAKDLSIEEVDELLAWIDEDPKRVNLLQEVQSIWDQSKHYQQQISDTLDPSTSWLKIKNEIDRENQPIKLTKTQPYKWLAIAASLIILCGLSWFSYQIYDRGKIITIANHMTNRRELLLPDGTKVWLNKAAEVKYAKGLETLNQREVTLVGEAFFEVKHDEHKPFIIHAGGTETQVLGTSFNINVMDEKVTVAVISGKVSFKKIGADAHLFLLPGEEGIYHEKGSVTKAEFKNANFLFWKNQTLVFENETLEMVLKEVEKAYHIKFNVKDKDLLQERITTSFKSAPLPDVIKVLEAILDLKIEYSGDAYIVIK